MLCQAFCDLASFGAAGLMGALWLLERKLSRQRDEQLTECHHRITRDEQRLTALTAALDNNTAALARFTETQRHLERLILSLGKGEIHA